PTGLTAMPGRKAGMTTEALELLRSYPRKRLQLHVLEFALSVYRKLLGNAPEYLREINFCRSSLNDLHAALAKISATTDGLAGPGRPTLPDGCANLDMAADRFLAGPNPEEILAFDQEFQSKTKRKFRGLAAVCLKPIEKGPLFREMLLTRARTFLDEKLDAA